MARGELPAESEAVITIIPPREHALRANDGVGEIDPATVRYPMAVPPLAALGRLELDFGEEDDPFGGLIPVEDAPLPLDEPFEELLSDEDILEALPAASPATSPARPRWPR